MTCRIQVETSTAAMTFHERASDRLMNFDDAVDVCQTGVFLRRRRFRSIEQLQ